MGIGKELWRSEVVGSGVMGIYYSYENSNKDGVEREKKGTSRKKN